MELRPPLHFGVVAIEKGTFRSPLIKVTNFTYIKHQPKYQISKQLEVWFKQKNLRILYIVLSMLTFKGFVQVI